MDIGRFTGRYLQAGGFFAVVSMIVSFFYGNGFVDFSVILYFWAGSALKKHQPAARKWVIGGCFFVFALILAMVVYAAIAGTEGMRVTIFWPIEHPMFRHVVVVAALLSGIAAVPCALLLTNKARLEFAGPQAHSAQAD